MPEPQCDCLDCWGEFLGHSGVFAECQSIDEMVSKLEGTLQYFHYLQHNAGDARMKGDDTVSLIPCLVGGNYWFRCPGCFYPVLLTNGSDPNILCTDCRAIAKTREAEELHPKYYRDLFDYLDLVLQWNKNKARLRNEDYWFTKKFCETHGFDDFEGMLNSQFLIPLFDELPTVIFDDTETNT